MLALESIVDLRKKRVWVLLPALVTGAGGMVAVFAEKREVAEIILCLGVTAVFFVISRATGEALGMGDVWIIGSILAVMGILDGIEILCVSFLLAAFYGSILFWRKKKGKKETFPFVPFLFLGTMGGMWMG